MKLFIHIFCLLVYFVGATQTNVILKLYVQDEEKHPILHASAFVSTKSTKIYTQKKGCIYLPVSTKHDHKIVVTAYGFTNKEIPLTDITKSIKKDTISLTVTLMFLQLKEVVVGGKKKPSIVYGAKETSVNDFVFIEDKLLLLSYYTNLSKNPILQIVDNNHALLSEYQAPKGAICLYTDYTNQPYLITETKIYKISLFKNEIRLSASDPRLFQSFTQKINDTLQNKYIYNDFKRTYPQFNYYHQTINDLASYKVFHTIKDSFMLDLFRAEYKYASTREKLWAQKQEARTGVDKETWIGTKNFTNSIYYKTPYAPLFKLEEQVHIFDHYKNKIYTYATSFKKEREVSITYTKDKYWEKPLIKDALHKKIYALYKKDTYHWIKEINLANGTTSESFYLHYKYVENIKIQDGYVYYIYRPYASSQRKYLYKEKIEFEDSLAGN